MIKPIYTLFLAFLIALFVGLGIDTFHPGPTAPKYPVELENVENCCEETPEQHALRVEFNENQRQFQEEFKAYSRVVSIVSLIAAIIILVLSLTLLAKIKMIADGILLGGVFTIIYSIMRGLMTEDSQFRFLIVTAGIIIAFVLGYIKFIRPKTNLQ
ncbi:MAG: hypothetical protein PHE52_02375 [Candidatus Pacebacteria bacterium]|nr:hypothetical protein [Candidatus Paceibacterota bacterium]